MEWEDERGEGRGGTGDRSAEEGGGKGGEERRGVIERKQCRGQVWLQMNRLSERERQLVIPIRAHAL